VLVEELDAFEVELSLGEGVHNSRMKEEG